MTIATSPWLGRQSAKSTHTTQPNFPTWSTTVSAHIYWVTLKMRSRRRARSTEMPKDCPLKFDQITSKMLPMMTMQSKILNDDCQQGKKDNMNVMKWMGISVIGCVLLNPAIPDPRETEIRQYQMLNLGPLKLFLLVFYIGNNINPPITDGIYWSLDIRYCGA